MLTNINLYTLFLLLIFFMPLFNTFLFCFLSCAFWGYLFQDTKKYFTHKENNNKIGQIRNLHYKFLINA